MFLSSHQILKTKRPKKKIPEWVVNDKKTQNLLLRSFPLMKSNLKQRTQAGRWARVINLYYKRQWSRGQIAAELHLTYAAVDSIIRALKRAAAGLRTDTGKAVGKFKGRPRKKKVMPVLKHILGGVPNPNESHSLPRSRTQLQDKALFPRRGKPKNRRTLRGAR